MLLLAAKLLLLGSTQVQAQAGGAGSGVAAPSAAESAVWSRIRNSIAVVTSNGQPIGPAAFISADGFLVTNSSMIQRGPTEVVTSNGLSYKFQVEAIDSASQLCLLKTTIPTVGVTAIRAADASDGESGGIYAVLTTGLATGELGNGMKIGIDQKTRRTFPIQEVRVEQRTLQVGGALLFTKNGHLVGALFASLAQDNVSAPQGVNNLNYQNQSQQKLLGNATQNARNLGPQGLVVGYTPTWEVTSKAIDGFLSPSRTSQYGLLGVFVKDSPVAGVEITAIQKGTGAEIAGLQVGDIILAIDGVQIRNQIDFVRAIYRFVPGAIAQVSYQRKGKTEPNLPVTIGSQLLQSALHPKSSTGLIDSPDIR